MGLLKESGPDGSSYKAIPLIGVREVAGRSKAFGQVFRNALQV